MGRRQLLGGAALAALLPGCGGAGDPVADQARLRLLNASTGYAAALDLQIGDSTVNRALAYGTVGAYADADSGGVTTTILSPSAASALSSSNRTLSADVAYTLVAYGWAGGLKTTLIEENQAAAASGKTLLKVMNLGGDAGALDVYLSGSAEPLDDASAVAAAVAADGSSGYISVNAGSYRLRVTGADNKADLRLDVAGLVLASGQVASLLFTPGSGGVLVSALLLLQQGPVSALANTQARVRVVSSVAVNGRVTASLGGSPLVSGAASPNVGSWGLVAAGTPALQLSVDGNPVAVDNPTLAAGGDFTLLVWGDPAAPQLTLISEDNRLPVAAGNAKIRLLHGQSGPADSLTLTADSLAVASNVALGHASAYANVPGSSTMVLEATSPLLITPPFPATSSVVSARGVYTLFVLGDTATPTAFLRKER